MTDSGLSPILIGAITAAVLALISAGATVARNWKKDRALARERLEDRAEARQDRQAAANAVAAAAERARLAAEAVEMVRVDLASQSAAVSGQLESLRVQGVEIHSLVNSQLTEAVERFKGALATIEAMRALMLRLAPDDPRVRELLADVKDED